MITINLNKGKNFGKIFYNKLKKGDTLFIPKGYAHGYCCLNKKNSILYFLNKNILNKIIVVLSGMIKILVLIGK